MSTRGLGFIDTLSFDGTNYVAWKIRMLNYFRVIDPFMERIVDMGFSPPKDTQNLSLEDEKNSYLNAQASNVLVDALSIVDISQLMPFRDAHELWTKLQDKYGVSKICGDDCSPSTSGRDAFSTSSTSPTCGFPQGNEMVSSLSHCNDDSEPIIHNPLSLSYRNASVLDLNTSSTINVVHACVDSPCISCRNHLNISHDDMLAISCCHDNHASISSSCCANNVEENQQSMEQDVVLNGASRDPTSASRVTHFCLMSKDLKVSPTLNPISSDGDDVDNVEEHVNIASLKIKGEMIFKALHKNKIACSNFMEIMSIAIEGKKYIEELEAHIEENEATIEKMESHERDYANEIADLSQALECEETTKESLEETFTLELSKVKESLDRTLEVANSIKTKHSKLEVAHGKLLEDFEHLGNGSRVIKGELIKLTESHAQLKASYLKELAMSSSPSVILDDACATNSISFEASILKENVELKAQLELLTSKYGKLEESHENLSSFHEDLLASHNVLKLAHEAKVSKLVPHVDISTTSTQYAIFPCASPCNSSTHNVATSCDELLSLPCFSNNASTFSSTCIVTNHVEEIKELKAQVTSLKKDLGKGHEGKSTLDKVLCGQKSPNDKGGLGRNSNNKKSMLYKKKGQSKVKNSAKIICFKCKVEGHHVRSCPLKKKHLSEKQQGKRPQVHVQAQVEVRPLPKKNQDNAPQAKKSMKKRKGSTCCYICRVKGHFASSCSNGTLSNI